MAKKFITYEVAKSYIKDKDKVINTFIQASLNKTQQIFLLFQVSSDYIIHPK